MVARLARTDAAADVRRDALADCRRDASRLPAGVWPAILLSRRRAHPLFALLVGAQLAERGSRERGAPPLRRGSPSGSSALASFET